MGLATEQELPKQKGEDRQWSVRQLVQLGALKNVITASFTNVFEAMLGFIIFAICLAELFDRSVPLLYLAALAFFAAVFYERNFKIQKK